MANSDHTHDDRLPPQANPVPFAQPVVSNPDAQPVPTAQPVPSAQPHPPSSVTQPGNAGQPASSAGAYPQPARPIPVGQQRSAYPAPGAQRAQPQSVPGGNRPLPVANQPVPVAKGGATRGGVVREMTPEEEAEAAAEQAPPVLKAAPPWLISLIVHVVILIVAALIFIAQVGKEQVDLFIMNQYAEEEGEQLEEEILDYAPLDQVEFEEAALTPEDLQPVEDPFAAPPITEISVDANSSMSDEVAPAIGMALTGREPGMKQALLAAYGGNATTEAAVKNGLMWLKKQQRKDGSWSLIGPYRDGGTTENQVAATAMALLAFQGAGHTHESGEFKQVVANGWNWMLKQQQNDGLFPPGTDKRTLLYTHAQATIALCELYGMTEDPKYKDVAQKAVDFCVNAQSPEGGWRYVPKQDSDTSVTGWFVMALQSALMAKLEVPSPNLENIHKFLDSVAVDGGRRYEYQKGRHENLAMCAEGLLCRQYLGWKHDDPRLVDGVARVVANPVDYEDQNVYYWYYGTQAAHHMEGELWDRWNRVMRQKVPENQVMDGPEAGSWDPTRDEWGARGAGRLYTTCLSIYMLEVYYRHLPIYAEVYKFRLQQF